MEGEREREGEKDWENDKNSRCQRNALLLAVCNKATGKQIEKEKQRDTVDETFICIVCDYIISATISQFPSPITKSCQN